MIVLLREALADGLLAMVLGFLIWAMWQSPLPITLAVVAAVVILLRLLRPWGMHFGFVLHERFNQWLEWPLWRRTAAIHEAGHVIVAHRLGLPVAGYALTPAASHLHQRCGSTSFRPGDPVAAPEQLLRTLTVLMGGKVSEEIILGQAHAASHDLQVLQRWAEVIDASLVAQGRTPVGSGFWQQACEGRARQILGQQQQLIDRVADLMVSGAPLDRVLATIDRASEPVALRL